MMADPTLVSVFHQWHCDHFGHVNTRHYAAMFDDAICAFWSGFGVALSGIVPVTAQMVTRFQSEAQAGAAIRVHAQLLRIGGKSVTLELTMTDPSGRRLATCEVVEVFFDTTTRKSTLMPDHIRQALQRSAGPGLSAA